MTALSRCDRLASLYADLLGDLPAVDRHNQYRIVVEGDAPRPSDPSLAAFYVSLERIRTIMAKRPCGQEFHDWLTAYLRHTVEADAVELDAVEEEAGPQLAAEWLARWEALEPWMQADVKERLAVLLPALQDGRAVVLLDRTCPCEYFKKSWGKHFHMVLVHELTEAEAADARAKLAAIPAKHDPLGHFVWTLDWKPRTEDMTPDWLGAFGIEVPWQAVFGLHAAAVPVEIKSTPVFAPANCRCTAASKEQNKPEAEAAGDAAGASRMSSSFKSEISDLKLQV